MLQTRLGACQALLGRGLRHFWTPFGRLVAGFWLLLGCFWTLSWAALGLLLGRFLAISWALSGATWLLSGAFWVHCSLPRRSGARFWRVSGHAGLGFRRLGRHVLACRSLRLAFHDRMLFVKSAWPWSVRCQQDLPKCFLNWAVWATCFYRCSTHAFAITCTLPSSLLVRRFVRSTWNCFLISCFLKCQSSFPKLPEARNASFDKLLGPLRSPDGFSGREF